MKTPNTLYSRLALITSVTLITGYFIVSAVWVPMNNVGTGDQLTATLWNTFVGNLNDLDARLKSTASTWPTVTGGIAYTGGNVGIGTTNPGGYRTAMRGSDDTSTNGGLWVSGLTAAVPGLMVRNDGNVGIGTASPSQKLTIQGPGTGEQGIYISNATGSLLLRAGSPGYGLIETINQSMYIRGNGGNIIINDGSGNVGIGTATPGAKLEVIGAANAYTAIFQSSLTASQAYGPMIRAGTSSTDTAFTVNDATNANPLFRVRGDGNVGIGTVVPRYKLQNNGDISLGDRNTSFTRYIGVGREDGAGWLNTGGLYFNSDGVGNVYVGIQVSDSTVGGHDALRISPTGNVGIGTNAPGAKLQVNTSTNGTWAGYFANTASANNSYGMLIDAGASSSDAGLYVRDATSANPYFIVRGNGYVGIGTSTPAYKLQLSTDSAAKPTSSTWTIASDKRIKKDINNFTDGLDTILALRPRTYKYNGLGGVGYDDTETHIGIVAQEVERVAPYMVETRTGMIDGKEVSDFKTYQGHALPFILVNAVKELKQENDELKSLVCLDHPTAPICKK